MEARRFKILGLSGRFDQLGTQRGLRVLFWKRDASAYLVEARRFDQLGTSPVNVPIHLFINFVKWQKQLRKPQIKRSAANTERADNTSKAKKKAQ